MPTQIRDRVLRLLSTRMNRDVPSLDTDLLETGVLDSMSLVELLLHLEQEFGMAIDLGDVELELLRTVTGIARMVQEFLNVPSSAGSPGIVGLETRPPASVVVT